MSEVLEDYLVSVGIKGQDVVLTETAKIKKSVDDARQSLSGKKMTADFTAAGKASAASFTNIRKEINARKQLEQIKRRNALTSGRRELESIRNKEKAEKAQKLEKGVEAVQGAGSRASGAFQGAMLGSLATQLPGLGALFGAAQSSIESAGQEFVAGVTARKNIRLIESNFAKAFGNAFGEGAKKAFASGMFSTRETQAMYSELAEQGVKVSTLANAKNVAALDKFARAQGVGSMEELFSRMQSGTLKEGAGLGKMDIEMLKSSAQLLNNRFTSDLGMKMILRTIGRKSEDISGVANMGAMQDLASSVRSEGAIGEMEQNYSAGAVGLFGKSLGAMYKNRAADRKLRAKMQGAARAVSNTGRNIQGRILRFGENIAEHGLIEGYKKSVEQAQQDYREGKSLSGDEAPNDSESMKQKTTKSDLRSMAVDDEANNIARAGSAIASTLNQINNQLQAMRSQFNTGIG